MFENYALCKYASQNRKKQNERLYSDFYLMWIWFLMEML